MVFLDINGHTATLDDESAFQVVMDAAEGLIDVEEIERRLSVVG